MPNRNNLFKSELQCTVLSFKTLSKVFTNCQTLQKYESSTLFQKAKSAAVPCSILLLRAWHAGTYGSSFTHSSFDLLKLANVVVMLSPC